MAFSEILRSTELVLKSPASPILPFLAPSVPLYGLRLPCTRPKRLLNPSLRSATANTFSTSSRHTADFANNSSDSLDRTSTKTKADAGQEINQEGSDAVFNPFTTKQRSNAESDKQQLDSLLDNLVVRSKPKEDHGQWRGERRRDGEILEKMKFAVPPNPDGTRRLRSRSETTRELLKLAQGTPAVRNRRTVQSRPSVGRFVELDPNRGMDFGRALGALGQIIRKNNIRGDQIQQRFHERPGLKRKRLKSERWRRYFKAGFVATVARVKQMKKQGW